MSSRQSRQEEIIWGIHPVREALRAKRRRIYEIYAEMGKTAPGRLSNIINLAEKQKAAIKNVDHDGLKRLTGTGRHQGIAARVSPLPPLDFSGLLNLISGQSDNPLLLIVDSIEDPHNLGALIRTAICAGITGIIVPKDRCVPPTPAVSRASAGALEHAPVYVVTNLVNAMKDLKKIGIWIIGLDRKGKSTVYSIDMTGPCAIVIGGENTGIRRLVGEHCDFLCHIPQAGPLGSLNASVAGAVAMYEARRQRLG